LRFDREPGAGSGGGSGAGTTSGGSGVTTSRGGCCGAGTGWRGPGTGLRAFSASGSCVVACNGTLDSGVRENTGGCSVSRRAGAGSVIARLLVGAGGGGAGAGLGLIGRTYW
jgi:hypothetical protein